MNDRILMWEHIASYACFLQEEERADATVEKYLRDIRAFMAWLNGRPVTKENTAQWKQCLLDQGQAPATVNARLSAVNGLFHFLQWEDCRVKFLRLQRRVFRDVSRELTRNEYGRLLEAARRLYPDWLELLMEAICATGIRVSEVKYITMEAVHAGRAEVSLKGKIRTILLPGKLCRKLLRYAGKQKITSGEIFRSKGGGSLSRYQIWKAMKKLATEAGVESSKIFPHNLRHLFAVTFYRMTHDIVKLADVLGHSSVETTRIYLRTTGTEHAQQLERLGLIS